MLKHFTHAALTWNQADSRRQTQETPHEQRGKKQFDRMEGWQNETRMTMCCYGDVILFAKNGIKHI